MNLELKYGQKITHTKIVHTTMRWHFDVYKKARLNVIKRYCCFINIHTFPDGINKSATIIRHFCFHGCFSKGPRIKKRRWSHDRKHWIHSELRSMQISLYPLWAMLQHLKWCFFYLSIFFLPPFRSHSSWQALFHRVGEGRSQTLRVLQRGRCLSQKYSCTETWLKSLVDKL